MNFLLQQGNTGQVNLKEYNMAMLVTKNQQINGIFERIITDKNGVSVRVRFIVVNVNNAPTVQVVSLEPLYKKVAEEVACLPASKPEKVVARDTTPSFISALSPYFSLDFLMSQPTRAPSFAI